MRLRFVIAGLLACADASSAAAQSLPEIDPIKICRKEAKAAGMGEWVVKECLDQEQRAYDVLKVAWPFRSTRKRRALPKHAVEVGMGYWLDRNVHRPRDRRRNNQRNNPKRKNDPMRKLVEKRSMASRSTVRRASGRPSLNCHVAIAVTRINVESVGSLARRKRGCGERPAARAPSGSFQGKKLIWPSCQHRPLDRDSLGVGRDVVRQHEHWRLTGRTKSRGR